MQRRDRHAQLADLFVGDRRDPPAFDEQLAVGSAGAHQTEWSVADPANHAANGGSPDL